MSDSHGFDTVPEEHYHPSQPPYQFYDRVLERTETTQRVIKNITRNEWCLVQDKTGEYFYPTTMLLECMAQAAGTLDEQLQKRTPPKKIFLSRIKKVEVTQLPAPGDQLIITAHFVKAVGPQVLYAVEVNLAARAIARAEILFTRQ